MLVDHLLICIQDYSGIIHRACGARSNTGDVTRMILYVRPLVSENCSPSQGLACRQEQPKQTPACCCNSRCSLLQTGP